MSTSSPVPNNNKVGESIVTGATVNGSTTPQRLIAIDTPRPNQRGQNKPKCIKCGNVARSRCPFQSCKNCCAKAQNPCHIHVLKQSNILPAAPPPSTTLPEQPSSDPPSNVASLRLSSLRQISRNYVSSMRVKKPLTRKDAVNINKWRFSKLKEHIEGNIEAENEAFDRYMWNVSLLEETFSTEGFLSDDKTVPESTSSEKFQKLVSSMKVRLRSNVEKSDSYREKTRDLVGELLRKLQERDDVSTWGLPYAHDLDAFKEPKRSKKGDRRSERTVKFNDLIDRLSKARSEDDLKPCLEMKHQLLNHSKSKAVDPSGESEAGKPLAIKQEPDTLMDLSGYSLPKMCTVVHMDQDHMDQEAISNIDPELSSLCQLAEL